MHNKLMIVDEVAAIPGGCNIGARYCGINHDCNLNDPDVLAFGQVARQPAQNFFPRIMDVFLRVFAKKYH
jgi:putative cardiolipin synthase